LPVDYQISQAFKQVSGLLGLLGSKESGRGLAPYRMSDSALTRLKIKRLGICDKRCDQSAPLA
jgi:hypothetical protein